MTPAGEHTTIYVNQSLHFEGVNSYDTNIHLNVSNFQATCFEVYTEVDNQKAQLVTLASYRRGFNVLLWNGELRYFNKKKLSFNFC